MKQLPVNTVNLLVSFFLLLNCSVAENFPVPGTAAARVLKPEVRIFPDHPDWNYKIGEEVIFHISVTCDDVPVEQGVISYQFGPEQFPDEWKEVSFEKGKVSIKAGTMDVAGFLRCAVEYKLDGILAKDLATAAFEPEKIQPTVEEPDDFDTFWEREKRKNADIDISLTKVKLPERCTEEVNVYHISFQSFPKDWRGNASRIYGILTEPVNPGNYPAVLQVPGAGVRAYNGDVDMAAKGIIVLQMGIHGIPVTLDDSVYGALGTGALNGYQYYGISDRETHYYHRVYLGCVRAIDVLTQHPMWDGKSLLTFGGSQGGQLSMVTAGLDSRVTGNVSAYPAYCDLTGYLYGRAGGWPHTFRNAVHNTPEKIDANRYYDVVNFAKRITQPSVYGWGYNDQVCPPTSLYAAYNSIPGNKKLLLNLQMGHGWEKEFWDRMRSELYKLLELEP